MSKCLILAQRKTTLTGLKFDLGSKWTKSIMCIREFSMVIYYRLLKKHFLTSILERDAKLSLPKSLIHLIVEGT